MKKLLSAATISFVLLISFNSQGQQTSVSYDMFYSQLSPYGNWVNSPVYGSVWQPASSSGFRPYETAGHWVPTVDGWAWASDYNWGWAPFHYGRWTLEPGMGWVWVPGYDWAPAWVTWGQYQNYYAWAPLSPGANINGWSAPYNYWSFARRNYISRNNLNHYIVRPQITQVTVNHITIINHYNTQNNITYHQGPKYEEVQTYTKRLIRPVAIAAAKAPGVAHVKGSTFTIYKPVATKAPLPTTETNKKEDAPAKTNNDLKPAKQTQPVKTAVAPITPVKAEKDNLIKAQELSVKPQAAAAIKEQDVKPDGGVQETPPNVRALPVKPISPANGNEVPRPMGPRTVLHAPVQQPVKTSVDANEIPKPHAPQPVIKNLGPLQVQPPPVPHNEKKNVPPPNIQRNNAPQRVNRNASRAGIPQKKSGVPH